MDYHEVELDVVIVPEGEGKSRIYSISAIRVPNVVTQGKTIDEAKKRLKEALNLYFEDMVNEKRILVKNVAEGNNSPLITRMML